MSHLEGINFGTDQINPFSLTIPYFYSNNDNNITEKQEKVNYKFQNNPVDTYKVNPNYVDTYKVNPNYVDTYKVKPNYVDTYKVKPTIDEKKYNFNNQDLLIIIFFILIIVFVIQIKIMSQLNAMNKIIIQKLL